MALTFITETEITVSSANSWVDVDVSALVPASAVGIMVYINNTNGSAAYIAGIRKNGSTDDRKGYIEGSGHTWQYVGLDGSRIFEAYSGNTTYVNIFVQAYFESADAVFNTNATDIGATTSYADYDLNVGDSAKGVILECVNSHASNDYPFFVRNNGSTDDFYIGTTSGARLINGTTKEYCVVGVDANEIYEVKVGHATYINVYVTAYLKGNFYFYVNMSNLSLTTTGAWTDLTALPTTYGTPSAGFINQYNAGGTKYEYGLRKNGSTSTPYLYRMNTYNTALVECDVNGLIEGIIANRDEDFYLTGYCYVPNIMVYVNIGGTWKQASSVSVNIGGTWKTVDSIKGNIGGTWK